MKKAVFFDIDGTLLDDQNYIPASAIDGIHKLQKAGNYAFICTGRTKAYVRDEALLSIGFDGIVSGCGTMVEFQGKELYYYKLDAAQVKSTITFLKDNHIAAIMEGRYYLFLDGEDFGENPFIDRLRREIGDGIVPIMENEDIWEICKFSCDIQDTDLSVIKQGLEKDYSLIFHDEPVVEVVPKCCSKGTGILKVCEKLGLDVQDTYAIGDSVNDLPMFEAAGHSIAMGNSSDFVKTQASFVTDSLHEDGIYHALEHFGLFL